MSRSDNEHLDRKQRDADRAARRANRLADRADQRAQRKSDQAIEAQERAERLAERARQRTGSRSRNMDSSIEDYVDEVTGKWIRKTEDWIQDQSRQLFDRDAGVRDDDLGDDLNDGLDDGLEDRESKSSAARDARRAREAAEVARKAAEKAEAYAKQSTRRDKSTRSPRFDEDLKSAGRFSRRENKRRRASSRHSRSNSRGGSRGGCRSRWSWPHRSGRTFYRDSQHSKIFGICAGLADYLDMDTWVVRGGAILGLLFMGQIVVPAYFILYFVLDDKPLYLKVTDKYDEVDEVDEPYEPEEDVRTMAAKNSKRKSKQKTQRKTKEVSPEVTKEKMRLARQKFSGIEQKLRAMERHVTSSQFQLHREFSKMARDEPKGAV